jgi:hypothetical protein
MPENNLNDLITDQEMAFARLILSGKMTDRQAAGAVGLNPDTAASTKSKPGVRAWMLEHRAAVQQLFVEQDTGELRRFNVSRDQILTRLWEIANMEPERTRNSMTAQVKALSMIVAIEGLIPDHHSARRAVSAQNMSAPSPVPAPFYKAAWNRTQQDGENADPGPFPAPAPEEARQEDQQEAAPEPQSAPVRADGPPPVSSPTPDPTLDVSEASFFGSPLNPPQTTSSVPRVPMADHFAPDTRVPFSIPKNPFARRRL